MAKKEKLPRTRPFTARELIVELAKCDPHMPVYFEHGHESGYTPFMFGVDAIDPKSPFCGGVAVLLKNNTTAAAKK